MRTRRPSLSELGDALRCHDRGILGEYHEVVDQEGCAMDTETLFIG